MSNDQQKLDFAVDQLPEKVATRVNASLQISIESAAKKLRKRFDEANVNAVRATEAYRYPYESSKYHLAIWVLGFTSFVMVALIPVAYLFLPSLDEIQHRRAEREALMKDMEWLQQSAQADIKLCQIDNKKQNLRLCAKFDPQFSEKINGYQIISKTQ